MKEKKSKQGILSRSLDAFMPSRHMVKKKLTEKIRESLSSVLPITFLVLLLSVRILPVGLDTMGLFLVGAVLLIVGMGLFTLGADTAMLPMGTHMGSLIARKKSVSFLVISALLLGILITAAEPDLHVLADQISGESIVLIIVVAGGVGMFLVASLLRILFNIRFSYMLLIAYGVVFILGIFVPSKTIALCFDSGGVTTGPITVPFIVANTEAPARRQYSANVAKCGAYFLRMLLTVTHNAKKAKKTK